MWFVYIMIAHVLWSAADVIMSIIMNRVHKSVVLVAWYLNAIQLCVLGCLYILLPIEATWLGAFALCGVISYLGTLAFHRLLQHVDVSVSSVAWVFLSLGIAFGGIIFFEETWTTVQTVGAVLSVVGALALALWHKRVERLETVLLILIAGICHVPNFLVQKAALLQGHSIVTVFFWPLLFLALCAVLYPLHSVRYRRSIHEAIVGCTPLVVGLAFFWVAFASLGFFAITSAYQAGDASLVGIAENGQPFFLIFFAWIALRLFPRYAPKEIVTAQTVGVKIISFTIVFIGLSLLVIS